ncbi:hypothetical protein ACJ5NV_01670 [Loktanella agnita]|uniref:hypothetical protein n=1 Tax=Loktanella agnita TaxID=287097 RepID=UPI0039872B94
MTHGEKTVKTLPSTKRKPRYIIGSGWWSSESSPEDDNPLRKKLGDPHIRSVEFFDTWYRSITSNASPDEIIVIDSCAPVKPRRDMRDRVRWITLPFNARHSTDHIGQWSGWMRSVILSATYAMTADCEYFVYVEQDCLLGGAGIIEHCIDRGTNGLIFGAGKGTPQPIQQSFFIVRADRLPNFISNLCALKMRDAELSPEWKFLCASSRVLVFVANLGLLKYKWVRKGALKLCLNNFFEFLPIGSGRARPIPFDADFFYFQHATRPELDRYLAEKRGV